MCLVSHLNLNLCWLGAGCSGYLHAEVPRHDALWRGERRLGVVSPGIFGCREHIQRPRKTGADQSALGFGGPWGRGVCTERLGCLLRQIDYASDQAAAAEPPPDVPAG